MKINQTTDEEIAFVDNLLKATELIDERYINLPVDGGDPILRERVYCYELYHQMRLLIPNGKPYFLMAEVDKRAHPTISKIAAKGIVPDLLAHVPGTMKHNLAAVEIKHTDGTVGGIDKRDGAIRSYERFENAYHLQHAA